jgi:hypothetical protein
VDELAVETAQLGTDGLGGQLLAAGAAVLARSQFDRDGQMPRAKCRQQLPGPPGPRRIHNPMISGNAPPALPAGMLGVGCCGE